jgi:hypothetical protein
MEYQQLVVVQGEGCMPEWLAACSILFLSLSLIKAVVHLYQYQEYGTGESQLSADADKGREIKTHIYSKYL